MLLKSSVRTAILIVTLLMSAGHVFAQPVPETNTTDLLKDASTPTVGVPIEQPNPLQNVTPGPDNSKDVQAAADLKAAADKAAGKVVADKAAADKAAADCPGTGATGFIDARCDLAQNLTHIYDLSVPFIILLGFMGVIYAGYIYITSFGQPERINEAKAWLIAAVSGISLILLVPVILEFLKTLKLPGQ